MSDHPRPCPVIRCKGTVDEDNGVMCEPHWGRVPEDLKQEVVSARRRARRLEGIDMPSWREADRLITVVQDRQESEATAIGEVELQEFEEKQAARKEAKAKART